MPTSPLSMCGTFPMILDVYDLQPSLPGTLSFSFILLQPLALHLEVWRFGDCLVHIYLHKLLFTLVLRCQEFNQEEAQCIVPLATERYTSNQNKLRIDCTYR